MTDEQNVDVNEVVAENQPESADQQVENSAEEANVSSDAAQNDAPEVKENAHKPSGMIPHSRVNKIVEKAKNEAYKLGLADALAKIEEQFSGSQYAQPNSNNAQAGFDESTPLTFSQYKELRERERQSEQQIAKQQAEKTYYDKVHNEFIQKVNDGSAKYQDFDEVTEALGLDEAQGNNPLVHLLNSVDNPADVLYEMGKNPEKLGAVAALLPAPTLARQAIIKLSNSIKNNQAALQQRQSSSEPLSQIKPSSTGVDSGSKTVSDFRKMPFLKSFT